MRLPHWFFGKPMTYVAPAFRDQVSGELVNYYCDADGAYWLATGPRQRFRAPVTSHLDRFEDAGWRSWNVS